MASRPPLDGGVLQTAASNILPSKKIEAAARAPSVSALVRVTVLPEAAEAASPRLTRPETLPPVCNQDTPWNITLNVERVAGAAQRPLYGPQLAANNTCVVLFIALSAWIVGPVCADAKLPLALENVLVASMTVSCASVKPVHE